MFPHYAERRSLTFAVRETESLSIMGEPRVPPLNPSESIVLSTSPVQRIVCSVTNNKNGKEAVGFSNIFAGYFGFFFCWTIYGWSFCVTHREKYIFLVFFCGICRNLLSDSLFDQEFEAKYSIWCWNKQKIVSNIYS